MLPNSTGVWVGLSASALTRNDLLGVANTAPRARPERLALKKSGGNGFGSENSSGTPSQLISRRPLPREPGSLALRVPRAFRKASTVPWMAAAFGPAAWKTCGAAEAAAGSAEARATAATVEDRNSPDGMRFPSLTVVAPQGRDRPQNVDHS